MAKTPTKRRTSQTRVAAKQPVEKDSVYLLKIILYLLIGTFWVRIVHDGGTFPIPLGFVVGLAFAMHDHFRIDRKVEYAILVIAGLVSLVAGYGLNIYY